MGDPSTLEGPAITWVRRADGRERPLPVDAVSLRSDPTWPGILLEETRTGPGELPEGYLPAHTLVLNLQRPVRAEASWVDERHRCEATIAPGAVSLFPAGLPCATRWLDPVENVVVAISPHFLVSVIGEDGPVAALRPQLASDDPLATHVVLALRDVARARGEAGALYAETLGTVLAAHLLRAYGPPGQKLAEPRGTLTSGQLKNVVAYIGERIAQPLTLHDLAAVAGMSVYRFARMFKRCAGVSPHRYLLERRLELAKTLLNGTKLAMGDIAMRCGFSHPSHFTSTFQRAFAITPTRYRQVTAGQRWRAPGHTPFTRPNSQAGART